jgi:hypothetical protein
MKEIKRTVLQRLLDEELSPEAGAALRTRLHMPAAAPSTNSIPVLPGDNSTNTSPALTAPAQ